MEIVEILAPVFLIVGLGAVLRSLSIVTAEFGRSINAVVYRVALPVLLFRRLSPPSQEAEGALELFLLLTAGTLAAIAVAFAAAPLLRLPGGQRGSFVQASFRGNLAYVGLPITMALVENTPAATLAPAILVALGPTIILYNIASVLIFTCGSSSREKPNPAALLNRIFTNPLIVAIAAGLIWSSAGTPMPAVLDRSLEMLGRIALPLALLSVGISLVDTKLGGRISAALWSSIIKLVVAPAVGWAVGTALHVEHTTLVVGVTFLACPCAVAGSVLAEQLGGDHQLAGSAVVISTILSTVTLALVLSLA